LVDAIFATVKDEASRTKKKTKAGKKLAAKSAPKRAKARKRKK
jgi:hypothetical protein